MSFYVFQCNKCKRWNSKEVRKLENARFKCVFCNYSVKIKSQYGLSLKRKGPYTAKIASEVCKELNKRGEK